MSEILKRLKRPLNKFWSRMRTVLLTLSTILIAIGEFAQPILHDELVPEEYKEIVRYLYIAGYFGALLATLTVDDPKALEDAAK